MSIRREYYITDTITDTIAFRIVIFLNGNQGSSPKVAVDLESGSADFSMEKGYEVYPACRRNKEIIDTVLLESLIVYYFKVDEHFQWIGPISRMYQF